ncbi:MAG: hypothetical protein HOQ44_04035, partial [Nocardia sp.]|nr:hypothetical protein [Nocardia sp.]
MALRITSRDRKARLRPIRVAGMEWGTAVLVVLACLVVAAGTAVLTGSIAAAVLATVFIALGLVVTLRIL